MFIKCCPQTLPANFAALCAYNMQNDNTEGLLSSEKLKDEDLGEEAHFDG